MVIAGEGYSFFLLIFYPTAQFKEILKRTFNVRLTPGELAALMSIYDKESTGKVKSIDFLTIFFKLGNDERARFHSESILAQREAEKLMREEQRKKAMEADAKSLYKPDYQFEEKDRIKAMEKMEAAAAKYDRTSRCCTYCIHVMPY